jgi:hypothetical protein
MAVPTVVMDTILSLYAGSLRSWLTSRPSLSDGDFISLTQLCYAAHTTLSAIGKKPVRAIPRWHSKHNFAIPK